jgi:hypothetical protein
MMLKRSANPESGAMKIHPPVSGPGSKLDILILLTIIPSFERFIVLSHSKYQNGAGFTRFQDLFLTKK